MTTTAIKRSNDYKSFDRIGGNRLINKAHVKRLKASISENPEYTQYTPLVINEKEQIIDGQHRFEALKELGLPIFYIEAKGLTLEDVQKLNSNSKSWTPTDYAKSWSELGKASYTFYLGVQKKYRFNHDILMKFVSLDEPITGAGFQNGKLKAPNTSRTLSLSEDLADAGQYVEHYKKRSFAMAFKQVWEHDEYDHERMLAKLKSHGSKDLKDLSQVEDNIRILEKIYNKNVQTKDRVRFF